MGQENIRDLRKPTEHKLKNLEWLLYLPGAIIISYGLWLAITLN